ncbi:MAG: zinc metalloprotease HtpX, partial [Nitrospirota bacterium]
IGSGYQMLCIVNPEATLLDETEGFWADMISTHPPIRKRIEILLCMAHTDFSTLNGSRKSERSKSDSLISACYALDPRHQWQGPFALSELAALPWLSPLTWVRMNSDQPIARAWENPFINQIFIAKLSQKQTVTGCNCPACHLPLMQESYKGTQIRQCRFCAGVLVDTDKIPRILARTTVDEPCMARMHSLAKTVMHENQLAQTRQKLTRPVKNSILLVLCPQCGNPMYRGFYSGVYLIEIDRCSMCGITWFDQDELMMLQSLIEIKRDNEKILQ